jgi:radical SAM protein with 4Fe4S-binding SPASM domain
LWALLLIALAPMIDSQNIPLQAVEIEINHACNRSCSYCPNSIQERKTKGTMSKELYLLILDQLKRVNFSGRISYDFYNEPMLHPELAEFVLMTKIALPKSKVHLYTNGTLLTEEKFKLLIESGVDKIIATRHENDMNDANYVFEKVYQELPIHLKAKVDYRTHNELILVNRGGLLKQISATGLGLTPCFIPSHMLTITVDGRVLSCFEDFNENLIFGDLKSENLIDIWHKDTFTQFRKNLQKGLRHLHSPCQECSRQNALPPFDV